MCSVVFNRKQNTVKCRTERNYLKRSMAFISRIRKNNREFVKTKCCFISLITAYSSKRT